MSAGADVRDWWCVVTGASSGIGRATALRSPGRGARLVLAARSAQALAEVERDCAGRGATVLVVPTDVSDAAAVAALFAAAVARFGRVDAVVHSAAVVAYGRFEDVPARSSTRRWTSTCSARSASPGPRCACSGPGRRPARADRLAAGEDRHALHELVRRREVGRPRAGPHPADRGPADARCRRQPGLARAASTPRSTPRPAATPVASAGRRRRSTRRRRWPGPWSGRRPAAAGASVGLANALTVFGFRFLPGVFDVLVTPLMEWGGRPVRRSAARRQRVRAAAGRRGGARAVGSALAARRPGRARRGSGAAVVAVRRARR